MSFKILGTGSYAPEHVVTNDDLSALVDTNDEWITQRIGVRSRHISETETNVDMAVKAAERALENAGIAADELDLIIATTITADTLSRARDAWCRTASARTARRLTLRRPAAASSLRWKRRRASFPAARITACLSSAQSA